MIGPSEHQAVHRSQAGDRSPRADVGPAEGAVELGYFRSLGWRLAGLLLLGSFLFLCSVISGHLYSTDGLEYFRAGEDLLIKRSWVYAPPMVWGGTFVVPFTPIGLSLAYWPALLLALPFLPFQPGYSSGAVGHLYNINLFYADPVYLACSWVIPLISAGIVVATAALALRLSFGRRTAIVIGLAAVFSGPLFFYARADFPQPLSALLLVTALYLAIRVRQSEPAARGVICLVLAAAILTRPVDGAIAVLATGVVLAIWDGGWAPPRRHLRAWVEVVAGTTLGLMLTFAVNYARRGSFFDMGPASGGFIGSFRLGLEAEIISPGRGLPWYLPLSVLAIAGAVVMWRSHRRALLIGLAFPVVPYFLVYAKWQDLGGWCWGPRYLTPMTPLIVILAAWVLKDHVRKAWHLPWAALFAALAVVGFLENFAHLGVDQLAYFWPTTGGNYVGSAGFWKQFSLHAFAPITSWKYYTGTPDILWFRLRGATHSTSLIMFALLLVLAGLCVAFAWRIAGSRSGSVDSIPNAPANLAEAVGQKVEDHVDVVAGPGVRSSIGPSKGQHRPRR